MKNVFGRGYWALVLGCSSGFGEAISKALAKKGMHIFGLHFDRRATQPNADRIRGEIEAMGVRAQFMNANAADDAVRGRALQRLAALVQPEPGGVSVVVHSLAFGGLKPFLAADPKEATNRAQLEMTIDVMANALVYWVQDLAWRGLLLDNGRIFAMTSDGGARVIRAYGPVGVTKALLESHVRYLAVELAPRNITVNAIKAGTTKTPAMLKIPVAAELIELSEQRNPHGRLGTPDDVAASLAALCVPETYWLTGNVINVDGGETISM